MTTTSTSTATGTDLRKTREKPNLEMPTPTTDARLHPKAADPTPKNDLQANPTGLPTCQAAPTPCQRPDPQPNHTQTTPKAQPTRSQRPNLQANHSQTRSSRPNQPQGNGGSNPQNRPNYGNPPPHSPHQSTPTDASTDIGSSGGEESRPPGWYLPKGFDVLTLATWNADALLQTPGTPIRKRKFATLERLVRRNLITVVQETHGSPAQWEELQRNLAKTCKIYHSTIPDQRGAGGIAIFVNLALLNQCPNRPTATTLIHGRALEVELIFPHSKLTITGIHNHLDTPQLETSLAEHCARTTSLAQADPYGTHLHLVAGDYNFRNGDSPTYRVSPNANRRTQVTTEPSPSDRTKLKKWLPYTSVSMAHYHPDPTRIGHTTNATDGNYAHASSIDRISSSLLGWQTPTLEMKIDIPTPVTDARTTCDSDHVPVLLRIARRKQRAKNDRPIPKWVAQHPKYKEILNARLDAANIPKETEPFQALQILKHEIRIASKEAIKEIMKKDPTKPHTRMQRVLQISRAIAYNDSQLARIVKKADPQLGECFTVSEDGLIHITNTTKFNETTAAIAKAFHDQENRENDSAATTQGKKNRTNHLKRLNDQWSPFSRKSVNLTITKQDGSPTTTPEEGGAALSDHWGQVFSHKDIDLCLADAILRRYANPIDLHHVHIPSEASFSAFLRHAKHSAPGPHGIPYAAWNACSSHCSYWLRQALLAMCNGAPRRPRLQQQH